MPRKKDDKPKFKLSRVTGKSCLYVTWSESGRSKRVSTGTDDETAAKQFLANCIAAWDAPPDKDEQTVKMAIDAYLQYKKEQYLVRGDEIEHSRTPYRILEFAFARIRPFFGHLKLSQLTPQNGRDYIKKRKKDNVAKKGKPVRHPSNATIAKELAVLNAAMNHVKNEKWIDIIPSMKLPPAPPARDKWMNPDQVRTFIQAIKTQHIKLFSLLAFHTLSRKTAILQLRWEQIDMENRMIDFNPAGRISTSKRRVSVPIGNILYAALEEAYILRQTDFVIEYGEKPIMDIKKAFAKVALEVGMPWVTPHVLRHTGATLLAQNGESLRKIAGLLGDTQATTERHYAKHHPDYQKSAIDKLEQLYA